jgi:hypothetical protein
MAQLARFNQPGHRAVRTHLLELAGDRVGATAGYLAAARRTTSMPEQRHLEARAARLDPGSTR